MSADGPDVGFVAGVDGALGAAPVALDEEPHDGFPAAPGIAHCDQPNGARAWVFGYRRDGKPPRSRSASPVP